MNVEQILEKNGLLERELRQVSFAEVRYKKHKCRIRLSISYGGNMGATLASVNEALNYVTSLDDTLEFLDALPCVAKEEEGHPDYMWDKVWIYSCDTQVSGECVEKYGGVK